GMAAFEIVDHALAHHAAQVEQLAGVAHAHQQAHLDDVFGGFDDLNHAHTTVPARVLLADLLQLATHVGHQHAIVQPQENGAQQLRAGAGPVLERVLDKPLQRHHQAPLVPHPYHHVGTGDLLDPTPLAVHDHH